MIVVGKPSGVLGKSVCFFFFGISTVAWKFDVLLAFQMLLCCVRNVSSDKRIGELMLELLKQTFLKDAIIERNAMPPFI